MKALGLGLLIDNGGTMLSGIVLMAVYAAMLTREGLNEEQVMAALQNLPITHWLSVLGIVAGSYFSALGGYVNERIARTGGYRLGSVQAALSIGIGLLMGGTGRSVAEFILLIALTVACVLAGVRLAHRTVETPTP